MQDEREAGEIFDDPQGPPDAAREETGDADVTPEVAPETPTPEPAIDWKDRCLRALAELDNANKTVPKRIQEGVERFKRGHFTNLLELADGFERALAQPETEWDGAWREGMKTLHRLLLDLLSRSGVRMIEAKAKPFDPAWHEAVSTVPAPGVEEGTILEVLRTGWSLDGRLLRPAMVMVARKN